MSGDSGPAAVTPARKAPAAACGQPQPDAAATASPADRPSRWWVPRITPPMMLGAPASSGFRNADDGRRPSLRQPYSLATTLIFSSFGSVGSGSCMPAATPERR